MIISKKEALKLIKLGEAKIETDLKPDSDGIVYTCITRYDIQRTDHFEQ